MEMSKELVHTAVLGKLATWSKAQKWETIAASVNYAAFAKKEVPAGAFCNAKLVSVRYQPRGTVS